MNRRPELQALAGQPVSAIDTPTLVVDLDAMERNLAALAAFARQHGVRWRAHAKMHKTPAIARLQVAAGAVGVCVQKTAEAEVMAAGGIRDVYISNEVIAPHKLARVAALAARLAQDGGRLGIAVDSAQGIAALASAMDAAEAPTIDVYVEIDVGQGRCGVPPGAAAVPLAQQIAMHRRLRFAGLQAYHGKAQHARDVDERHALIARAAQDVQRTCAALRDAGIAVPLVTGAGSGTLACEAASGVWGELQPGSFLFMDADYARNAQDPAQPVFAHALFLKSQVISRCASHAVVDAGHKSHAIDSGLPTVHVPGGPALSFDNGGDEHGILRAADPADLPAIGDVVWLIPGHCDPTVNLHDVLVGVRGGLVAGVVEQVFVVEARGALG